MRKHFTPAALGSALTGVCVSIGYVLNAQHSIHSLEVAVAAQGHQLELLQPELHRIDTELAVMNTSVQTIGSEVDRQREWRERIEDIAETAPRARRKP